MKKILSAEEIKYLQELAVQLNGKSHQIRDPRSLEFKKELIFKILIDLMVDIGQKECPLVDKYTLLIIGRNDIKIKSSCGPVGVCSTNFSELTECIDWNVLGRIIYSIGKNLDQ